MAKIVGKQILLFLLIVTSSLTAQVTLRLLNNNRSPLVQAGAGQPFIVDVTVTDVSSFGQMPTVQGIDQHAAKNSGMRISSVNGKTSACYSFEVRIDKPGTYTIGPAIVTDRGQQITSNILNVVVGQQQQEKESSDEKSSTKKADAPELLRLVADKTKVFTGQPVQCALRFYYTNPDDISLRQLIEQDTPDLRRSKAQGPFTGTEMVNGIDYNYAEWRFTAYPKTAGTITIAAYGADYERQIERDDFWGGLGRIFGSHRETKRIYSNGIVLQVDAIPASKEPINAVGHFSSFTLSADPSVAHQGEGIVVSLDLVGEGDSEQVIINGLEKLPIELKYYESKKTVTPHQDGIQNCIHAEYIVQGLKAGTWQIPAQSLYYFDTKKRAFHTIATTPLSLKILPLVQSTIPSQPDQKQEFLVLHEQGALSVPVSSHMPWWLFIVLVILPPFMVWYRFFIRTIRHKWQAPYGAQRAQKAFASALKRLESSKQMNRPQDLYKLFIECFADRWHQPIGTITHQLINQRLQAVGMSDEERARWQEFFTMLTQRAFSREPLATDNHLFNQAELWIQRLEKLL